MIAYLVREPFSGLDMEKISRLTDYQLTYQYFRARGEHGELLPMNNASLPGEDAQPCSYEEMVKSVWQEQGATPAQIEERWREFLELNPSYRGG